MAQTDADGTFDLTNAVAVGVADAIRDGGSIELPISTPSGVFGLRYAGGIGDLFRNQHGLIEITPAGQPENSLFVSQDNITGLDDFIHRNADTIGRFAGYFRGDHILSEQQKADALAELKAAFRKR